MFGMQIGRLGRVGGRLSDAQKILALFASGEPGAWYDPAGLSTLFQDSAFTTPVTAVEQPVGGMLDLSGRGNHASQATTTKRQIYSRRVNMISQTSNLGGSPWQNVQGASTYVGDKIIPAATTSVHGKRITFADVAGGAAIALSFKVKPGDAGVHCELWLGGGTNGAVINLSTWAITDKAGCDINLKEIDADGYRLIEVLYPLVLSAGAMFVDFRVTTSTTKDAQFVGDGVKGYYLKDPQIELASAAGKFQSSVNATDYDADPAKFPAFRRLDGVDDSLACGTGGGGSAGFFFSSVISPRGSAGTNRTLFSDAGANTGYIVRLNTSNQLELAAGNGTAYTTIATAGTLAVGASDVVQAWDDGVNLNVMIGTGPTASIARSAVVAGTDGYTLGQDNGASSGYFNGRSYGEIYRKDSAPAQAQREAVALYQRQKAKLP